MSRCSRSHGSPSFFAFALLLVAASALPARAGAATGGKLVDVKDADARVTTLELPDGQSGQQWSFVWNDLSEAGANVPQVDAAGLESFARVSSVEPKAPTVIAAPLPPALLPGLIGLAGVYAYKRRHRIPSARPRPRA